VALVTNKGLSAIIKEHYSKWLLYGVLILLVGANTFNVLCGHQRNGRLYENDRRIAIRAVGDGADDWNGVAQVTIPYRHYVKFLKYACFSLLAYVVIAVLPKVHVNWYSAFRGMVIPRWNSEPGYILTIVGFLGTTISPYLFFWQAGEQVEDDIAMVSPTMPATVQAGSNARRLRAVRADTMVGMIFSQIITVFIIISTAATLHASGKTDINTAEDAARALLPLARRLTGCSLLGSWVLGCWLFRP